MKTDSTNACPKCGATVPPEAPQGLCPQCVFAAAAAPEPTPTATSQIPSLERLAVAFPQLQILELIGRGGMGFVFKARQPHLDRFVALKLLPDSLAHDPQFAERFNREGRVLARLNHPNIVSIFDFGHTGAPVSDPARGGRPSERAGSETGAPPTQPETPNPKPGTSEGGFYYLMMEYVDGVNLRQAMQAGRFSPAEALTIVPKICEALQFAHEEGILHRDIKPENILLDAKGRVKIADFGIAKLVGEEHPDVSLTATGAALGTMHYMAPEQIEKPATVDHRADIYSLGVVFYELLTGELPLGRFGPPSAKTPVDSRVDDVVMRTLEKEREKRFQSAGEMGTTVEHLTEVGAGSFKGTPPKAPGAEPQRGPGGTMVINPSAVIPAVPKWSLKAVWGAVLVALGVPLALCLLPAALTQPRSIFVSLFGILILIAVPLLGIVGTIFGWMALSDIREHTGKLRGLPLAVFAAMTWPVLLLLAATGAATLATLAVIVIPSPSMLLLVIPAGLLTFTIWTVYAAAHWGANRPTARRRGVLKWVFAALICFGLGVAFSDFSPRPKVFSLSDGNWARMDRAKHDTVNFVTAITNTTPWIGFTITAVELREVQGVRWLAIDYLDDVHGECQKSFPWETTIPGFKATTRASEFLGGDTNAPVRHQRVEYQMPDSIRRDQLERLRDQVARTLERKSFRLELGEEKLLFEMIPMANGQVILAPPEGMAPEREIADVATGFGGSLKARIKVMPPPKVSREQPFVFGPVVERTVVDSKAGFPDESARIAATIMIDFDNGSLHAGSKEMWEADTLVQKRWMQTNKIDALAVIPEVSGLVAVDMAAIPVADELWEKASGAEVVQQIKGTVRRDTFLFSARGPGPATWLFRTREGGTGILQITRFTDNPRGVKIRYKLVQAAPAK